VQFKLVIIQSASEDLHITTQRFHAFGCEVLGTGRSGGDALELVRRLKPNALIMDAFLPGMNCDEIAEILEHEINFPLIKLAIADQRSDRLANRFFDNGGDLFRIAPLDFAFCIRQMEKCLQLRQNKNAPTTPECRIRNCTKKMLMQVQMPMTLSGFIYIIDGIELLINDRSLLLNLVDGLYPAIGRLHHKPSSNIERCIRTAIEKAFEFGDVDFLFKHFGHAVNPKTGKPANGRFLSILAELVRQDLQA
jgi:two-component system response regulator (stage 0 sporulation protein A)